jgi:hypothetical protein
MITTLVSSCKLAHELALSKKPTTEEIVLTEVEPQENNTSEELPERIAGHKVTYSDANKTTTGTEQPATIELNKPTNWLLIALLGLPPLLILIVVINRKIAKKLNENG